MACFLVSAAEAAVVATIEKKKEKTEEDVTLTSQDMEVSIPWSRKLKWLRNLLCGGSVLLLFEHIWHGEVVPWFPFLTNMATKSDAIGMFKEMATVGVSMALLTTVVWLTMCKVADVVVNRHQEEPERQ